jgi:cytochrome P450
MREFAEREIAGWEGEMPTHERMQAMTLSIILRTVFGAEHEGALHTALRRALDITGGPIGMAVMAVLGPERLERLRVLRGALSRVDALILEEIARRREQPGDDVLSMLVQARHEDGSAMTDREIRDELMTLLVAGHETTATSLAWAVERLARHPDAWARLQADGEPYADAVVKETLRLRPVLPVVVRRLATPTEVAGFDLPAGVIVAPCIWLLHRREDVYPQATRFRPERFLEQKPGTYTWIPFGGGVRRCLGAAFAELEMRIVLLAMAERVSLVPDRPEPEPVRRRAITLTPARGGRVRVGNRAPAAGVPGP